MDTKLKHIESLKDFKETLSGNDMLVVCAGRWGPMCIPVYKAMEQLELEDKYKKIQFRVVEFDTEAATPIKKAKECSTFMGLPFTVYYNKQKIIHATTSIQTKAQIEEDCQRCFF
ncbi:MAG: thioredoxin [Spirochaetota bacterium]|nr:thioredoxin [Spirochaetota bacterium]